MKKYFGLNKTDLDYIVKLLFETPEVEKALLFGSRSKNTYKHGSDIDIAVIGEKVNLSTIAHLHYALEEESPIPYFFDIIDYQHLKNKELRSQIEKNSTIIFERNN